MCLSQFLSWSFYHNLGITTCPKNGGNFNQPSKDILGFGYRGLGYQGYRDVQIDERTYFVLYDNYFVPSFKNLMYREIALDEKWLKGAQEYVLYRAGELAKSTGGQYFIALYKDDWNVIGSVRGKYGTDPIIIPGAGMIMRVVNQRPASMPEKDGRIQEVDKLLKSLAEKNAGLAEYLGQATSGEESSPPSGRFIRWRSSIYAFDHTKVPKFEWFNGKFWEYNSPVTTVVKVSANVFEIVISSRSWISPLQMLWQCVEIAGQEGYEVFTLEDWNVEQHGHPLAWFRTKAKVVLQHQEEPDSLLSTFRAEKIRPSVDTPDRFNRKYSGEALKDVRFGNTVP